MFICSTERRVEQVLRNSSAPDPFSFRTPANTVKPSWSRYLDKAWPIPESPPARGQGKTKWAQAKRAGELFNKETLHGGPLWKEWVLRKFLDLQSAKCAEKPQQTNFSVLKKKRGDEGEFGVE